MGKLVAIVDSLENRISKLLHTYDHLKKQNEVLQAKVHSLEVQTQKQADQQKLWEEKLSAVKNANALLGNKDYKKETRRKINTLIREIDVCIAQLSE